MSQATAAPSTLLEAWEGMVPDLQKHRFTPKAIDNLQAIFYSGAASALHIATSSDGGDVHDAILRLSEEIDQEVERRVQKNRQRIAEFPAPEASADPEHAKRARIAAELAKQAAEACCCPHLQPWLLKAVEHALALGATEASVRADVGTDPEWWHAQIHAGIAPEQAAATMARSEWEEICH